MELDAIAAVVSEAAAREPSVLAAWIFGSRVRGDAKAGSDLDVAVLAEPGVTPPPGLEDRVAAEVAGQTGLDADVSRIGEDRPTLSFEVLADGRRVFARDAERADVAEERLRWIYLDTAHLRRVQNHYLYGDPL
jgi:predicted nucleotidyltransferase